jgi:hypothetical protein
MSADSSKAVEPIDNKLARAGRLFFGPHDSDQIDGDILLWEARETVAALVEALKGMRNKLYSVAERHNDRSCDYDVCKEVRDCDAALKAAGVDTFGGLEESM